MHPAGQLVVTPVLLSAALAGDTLTVGPPGSGADFEEIQPAVDAADPGDTVSVLAGTYAPFSLSKPLVVIGAGVEETRIATPPLSWVSAVHVAGVGSEHEAFLSGFTAADGPFGLFTGPLVDVLDNEGTVVLHDVEIKRLGSPLALGVSACDRVIVSEATVIGTGGGESFALGVSASQLWGVGVETGLQPYKPLLFVSANVALGLNRSTVRLSRSTLVGQSKYGGFVTEGGDGVAVRASSLELRRSSVTGGQGSFTSGGYGMVIGGGAQVRAFGDTTVEGGLDGSASEQQEPALLGGSGEFVHDPALLPALGAPPRASTGESVDLALTGEPGAGALVFASLGLGPALDVPGIRGSLHLDVASLLALGPVDLSDTGEAVSTVALPDQPGLSGRYVAFQWLDRSSEPPTLSNVALLLVE